MASTRIIEQDRGTYVGHIKHRHNGYYAGDFRDAQQGLASDATTGDRGLATAGGAQRTRPVSWTQHR